MNSAKICLLKTALRFEHLGWTFTQVWRRDSADQGVQGLCPGKLETLCCRNGASEARPRAEGTGHKLVSFAYLELFALLDY